MVDGAGARLQVVTYDPVRRKGFMALRAAGAPAGARVHFVLAQLPDLAKRRVVEASRGFNARPALDVDAFRALSRSVRALLVGREFLGTLRRGKDGRLRLVPRSVHLVDGHHGDA